MSEDEEAATAQAEIKKLPEEILERVFLFTSQYK